MYSIMNLLSRFIPLTIPLSPLAVSTWPVRVRIWDPVLFITLLILFVLVGSGPCYPLFYSRNDPL